MAPVQPCRVEKKQKQKNRRRRQAAVDGRDDGLAGRGMVRWQGQAISSLGISWHNSPPENAEQNPNKQGLTIATHGISPGHRQTQQQQEGTPWMSATLIPPVTNGVRSGRHHHHHQHHGRSHKRVQPLSLSHQPQPSPSQADLLTPPSHGLPSTPRSPLFSGLIDVMEKDTGLPFHDSASSPEVTVLSEKPTEHTAKPPPEHKHPSRISLRLLKASEKWPLLHAILEGEGTRDVSSIL
uniref:Uncharacterized protein n=1 Tax=Coccidioides posadasii RMSCC 3488 TaxID=454284 RepID=A0A0J6F0V7_COCPO|nr:hypothetical protein CPAG_00043 [Coccidioides posadasii RMSCC 3488]